MWLPRSAVRGVSGEDLPAFAYAPPDAIPAGDISPLTAGQLMDAARLKTGALYKARLARAKKSPGSLDVFDGQENERPPEASGQRYGVAAGVRN